MKKSISNSVVCVGSFSGPDIEEGTFHGPDIEEGTFHKEEAVVDVGHKDNVPQKCPCSSTESSETKVPDDSNND